MYITVSFNHSKKTYYFTSDDLSIKEGDYVLVETVVGKEIAVVQNVNVKIKEDSFIKEVKPIIGKATEKDLIVAEENEKLNLRAAEVFKKYSNQLNLDMRLISTQYTFDRVKVLFIYASEDRIDFRELLKLLAGDLHCRIELRQINSRERAQNVGGIGVCGLELCCATFFKTFEGISLNRAKNQMLAINIPKLSGQCGKLMCCLKYEDDLYTEAKKRFPKFGTICTYNDADYKVTGYNILTNIVKIENEDNVEFIKLHELKVKHE